MRSNLILLSFLSIILANCSGQKKVTTEKKTLESISKEEVEQVYEEEVYEVSSDYQDTRKIKYLSKDSYAVVAFFDNGRATLIRDFDLCKEKMFKLYEKPSEYSYEIVGNIVSFSKREDDFATGIKLSSNFWIIKNFTEIVEIKTCK